jgi:hypothetical protein
MTAAFWSMQLALLDIILLLLRAVTTARRLVRLFQKKLFSKSTSADPAGGSGSGSSPFRGGARSKLPVVGASRRANSLLPPEEGPAPSVGGGSERGAGGASSAATLLPEGPREGVRYLKKRIPAPPKMETLISTTAPICE